MLLGLVLLFFFLPGQPSLPLASALSVDVHTPGGFVHDGTALAANVSISKASAPVEIKAWLGGDDWQASRTWNGSAFQRSDHYAFSLKPDEQGTWNGKVWVKANPASNNAQRLASEDRVKLGVRARSAGERASAMAELNPLDEERTSWAVAGPNRSVRIMSHGELVVEMGAPQGPRPIAVPQAREDLVVCGSQSCGPRPGLGLDRVDEEGAALRYPPNRSIVRPPGVLLIGDRACALPAMGLPESGPEETAKQPLAAGRDPGVRSGGARVTIEQMEAEDRCVEATPTADLAQLFLRGRLVSSAPDRPSRGHVVWDEATGSWAPWRLPAGAQPERIQTQVVEGFARVFPTRTQGLEVFEQTLTEARDRVTVSTYMLTSRSLADVLAQTAARGVDVHLWIEPDPVGGQPGVTEGLLDELRAAGVSVHEAPGPSRGGLQHAKIIVVDSSLVLVLTENLTNSGLPFDGQGNRGLGIGVANASLAGRVEATFRAPNASLARQIQLENWRGFRAPVAIVTAPENAWRASGIPAWIEQQRGGLLGAVLRANTQWGPRENPWLTAMVNHSREHPVEVLLSGAPRGAAFSNRETVAHLAAHPGAGKLGARVSDPRAGTVHAKVIIGPQGLLVGSSNWGLGGALLNREVNLLVHDRGLAEEAGSIVAQWHEGDSFEPEAGTGVFVPSMQEAIPGPSAVAILVGVVVAVGLKASRATERGLTGNQPNRWR